MKRRLSKTGAWNLLRQQQENATGLCFEDPTILESQNGNEAAIACAGCPLLLECWQYGKADKAASGVWGGEVFPDRYPDDDEEDGKYV